MVSGARRIRVAIDALGGVRAPQEPVRAAALLSRETEIDVLLVGPSDALQAELDQVPHNPSRLTFHSAGTGERDLPMRARGRESGEILDAAAQAVAHGEADALVTAGDNSTLVQVARRHLPLIPGVQNPALATVYPTRERSFSNDRFALLLDVGASTHNTAQDLLFFAYMGHAYASRVSKVPHPAVALLNTSHDPDAGDDVLTCAHRLMRDDGRLNFIGNIDGRDLPRGLADVVVCEGFVGQVVTKLAAGVSDVARSLGAWAFRQRLTWRLGLSLLASGVRQMKPLTDYREYGGAPLLGFRHMIVKTSQDSTAAAIANAAKVAAKAVRDQVCLDIEVAVQEFLTQAQKSDGQSQV